jgi:hypothetical protein
VQQSDSGVGGQLAYRWLEGKPDSNSMMEVSGGLLILLSVSAFSVEHKMNDASRHVNSQK